jgi:hypothetical protein
MLKKLLLASLLIVFGFSAVNAQLTKAQINKVTSMKSTVKMVGDAIVGVRTDGKPYYYGLPSISEFMKSISHAKLSPDSWSVTTTYTPIGCASIYDLCSNGSPVQIWQDPATPDNIHIAVVYAPLGDGTSFPNRRTKYFFSSDRGVTWTYMTDVPTGIKSGFPTITGCSDGAALVGNHTTDGAANTILHAYKDAFAGTGSFTNLYPTDANTTTSQPIWPRFIMTSNLSLSTKFVAVASQSGNIDSTYYIRNTGMGSTPGSWSAWHLMMGADQAETYALARGSDGRIGLAYTNSNYSQLSEYGSVWFMESTDMGATFSAPLLVFHANFATGDSLGCLRGLSLVYSGTSPKLVFETIKQDGVSGYYAGLPAKIRFWSPSLPGSDPNRSIVIADTTMIGYHPYIGVNDVLATLCRPTIGISADGNVLMALFHAPADYVGGVTDTTTFMDVYLTASGDNGATWKTPIKINPTTPVYDWRWVSISPWNDNNATTYYANCNISRGIMPGSYVNGSGNGESAEPYYFMRIAIPKTEIISVNQISTEVPASYSLSQNYPNPFNPTTNIKFAVSKAGFASLKVYNLAGKEIATLVNQNLSVGTFEYKFDASNLSSGIYFYTLNVNGFTETKKMMLIK